MSKTPSTASSIRDKIANLIAGRAKTDEEIARLERAARWADGAERRARLVALAEQARKLSEESGETLTRITEAANVVTDALANLAAEVDAHNDRLADIRSRIGAENPRTCSPPSPADGYVTIGGSTVTVGDTTIHPVNGRQLADRAIRAASDKTVTNEPPKLTTVSPDPEGPFWRHPEHGGLFNGAQYRTQTRDLNNPSLVEITRAEWLAAQWGLDMRELPQEVLDTLTDRERAKIAEQLLPQDAA
ncbi:MAG: hypothetical protein J2P27_01080 [Actinobacteria bacterium]|nr:hypothetical protein [Actinomycetota bacterium]